MDDSGSDGEENPLIKAAKVCDLDALRRALAEGCDVNYREPGTLSLRKGYSALHHLCSSPYERRLACVAALIRAGADVNQRAMDSDWPSPPIFLAARFGSPDVVRALIDAGADVTMAHPDGSKAPGLTPLHTAAIFGCAGSILLLLAAGADVNAVSHRSETPLDGALRMNLSRRIDRRTFVYLLRAGARIPTHPENPLPPYLDKVRRAGGFIPYERAHRTRLAAIFIPKFPQLPAEVVHHILPFWADVGGH